MAYSAKTNWVNNDIVKPADMNRIEEGIAALDKGKADASMSNVTDAAFLAKAKQSKVATYPTSLIKLYVASSGDPFTGDGSAAAPFSTIQKAIDAFPDCNDLGVEYVINVAEGGYPEFTLNSSKNITMYISGAVSVTADITIKAGNLKVVSVVEGSSFSTFAGALKVEGGNFSCHVPLGLVQPSVTPAAAITCKDGASFSARDEVIIMNFSIGIDCEGSVMHIRKLTTQAAVNGVICESGIVVIGAEEMEATTKFITQHGGRIYLGAQTNMPNY